MTFTYIILKYNTTIALAALPVAGETHILCDSPNFRPRVKIETVLKEGKLRYSHHASSSLLMCRKLFYKVTNYPK